MNEIIKDIFEHKEAVVKTFEEPIYETVTTTYWGDSDHAEEKIMACAVTGAGTGAYYFSAGGPLGTALGVPVGAIGGIITGALATREKKVHTEQKKVGVKTTETLQRFKRCVLGGAATAQGGEVKRSGLLEGKSNRSLITLCATSCPWLISGFEYCSTWCSTPQS
jgi:hypothetical protein